MPLSLRKLSLMLVLFSLLLPLVTSGDELPNPDPTSEADFTVAWLSDTQRMVYQSNTSFQLALIMEYVEENRENENIICMLQTGDFADNMWKSWQADICDEAVALLKTVPFLAIAGNHDIGYRAQNYAVWLERPFVKNLPEEQKYRDGRCVYGLFSSGGTEVIAVGLGTQMRADREAIAWARDCFYAHPEAVGILFCHEFLNEKGEYLLGYPILEEIVAKCPNVRLVLCGHSHSCARTGFTFDDDGDGIAERTVNALLFDYQNEWNDKTGYFQLLTFHPADRSISVISYSPLLKDYICHDDAPDRECFVLENAF